MRIALLLILSVFSFKVFALNVFACEPEWASLAQELGGDKVSVVSATTARQDPHHIEARPSLIARMRAADLVVCSGSELEIGWLPLLLTQSGNNRVQPGSPGYLEASRYVLKLEVPTTVDRSMGDVHPGGNPHVHTDPRNIARVAKVLAERLAQLDAANAATYRSRADAFDKRWAEAIARWEKQAAPLKGVPLVQHHKGFTYLINWLGMREVGDLEPKPGIPPTTSHLAGLVEQMKKAPAKMIVYSSYDDPKAAQFLSQRTGIPNVMLPFTVGGSDRAKDLFGYFDDLVARLLTPLQ
ncbi:MAG TPA: zinc ABC transporter substrate-binding protein [Burkholderiales bacterium]|jgi:zinc/manganese transport system substrate-binding protein|nr:zinc ABC transporter substrate-binding protein [Burkholderiales bacterium]